MNLPRWKQPHGSVVFMAKLTEEVGEVGKALRHRLEGKNDNLVEELDHVIYIATCWREQEVSDGTKT